MLFQVLQRSTLRGVQQLNKTRWINTTAMVSFLEKNKIWFSFSPTWSKGLCNCDIFWAKKFVR